MPNARAAKGERIAKVMARAGLCSRREAERWIADGRVAVRGTVLKSPAVVVGPDDAVTVDGVALPQPGRARLFRYHKPRGFLTTTHDPQGRPTIFEHMPRELPRLVAVGRLDFNSEGLLLLTTDGGVKRHLELPATGWARRYRVRVFGSADPVTLAGLKDGITIDGITYGAIEAVLERKQGRNAWLNMTLREGKNREVRRVLEHLGLTVNRLIRIAYGSFQLGDLPPGAIVEVPAKMLRDALAAAPAASR
jgi:23S rRNA pseudouridine2605 synthase